VSRFCPGFEYDFLLSSPSFVFLLAAAAFFFGAGAAFLPLAAGFAFALAAGAAFFFGVACVQMMGATPVGAQKQGVREPDRHEVPTFFLAGVFFGEAMGSSSES